MMADDSQEVDLGVLESIKAIFKKADVNGDGVIEKSELFCILKDVLEELSDDEVTELIDSCDKNKDGVLDFDEFFNFIFLVEGGEEILVEGGEENKPARSLLDFAIQLKDAKFDAVVECFSGLPAAGLKKLQGAIAADRPGNIGSLLEALNDASLEAVVDCLSGLPSTELKKLEGAIAARSIGPLPTELKTLEGAIEAGSIGSLLETLQDSNLDAVVECFSALPPASLKKLEGAIAAGSIVSLIERLKDASFDAVVECCSNLTPAHLKKLEEAIAAQT